MGNGLVVAKLTGVVGGRFNGESVGRSGAERASEDGEGREGNEINKFGGHRERAGWIKECRGA